MAIGYRFSVISYSKIRKYVYSSSMNRVPTAAGEGVFAWVFLRISPSILALALVYR